MTVPILRFRRKLAEDVPISQPAAGIAIRPCDGPDDVAAWLTVRNRAFEGVSKGARPWTEADFAREFPADDDSPVCLARDLKTEVPVGIVGLRIRPTKALAVIHWLAVDPAWQRRGIARALVTHAEAYAQEAGCQGIEAETHAGWIAAVAFYRALGYQQV